jgi:hypothetical protein
VDLTLWTFLSSHAVREFFARSPHRPGRGFAMIMKEAAAPSGVFNPETVRALRLAGSEAPPRGPHGDGTIRVRGSRL